ncbi:MAG: FAD-dependent oxidoreductase [Synechococcus sp. MED-G67]|nr:MAG: FAD-dependent oxidoreductase [Synechococcus sp. MED-G67]|tara:strand:- start:6976 stop:8679 length:1704 start_codon:yes stop_codon:yes gene_type:complete
MAFQQGHVPVLVIGGGIGGCGAALQCARSGVETLLVTPGRWTGGMITSGGVSAPDGNELSAWQSGLWGALLRQLRLELPDGLDHNWVSCFGFRPQQAESILQRWIREARRLSWWSGVEVLSLERNGDQLSKAVLQRNGEPITISFDVLVDGSELGDSLALADIPHRLGWDSQQQWGEPSAPSAEALKDPFFEREPVQSPTWVIHGQWQGPWTPPEQPVEPFSALFKGCADRFSLPQLLSYGRLPGQQLMLNWPLHGNDWPVDPGAVFSGDAQRQREQLTGLRQHSEAFLAQLQAACGPQLQPASAFAGEALAFQPYWREGRRLIGATTVIEQDLLPHSPNAEHQQQAIAIGNYANDHHYGEREWPLADKSMAWGGRRSGTPFVIPFGALYTPEISNLLMADKSISVSHMANGATRMGPLLLLVGQAAGQAAALCVQQRLAVAELPVSELQRQLLNDPVAPSGVVPCPELPWHQPDWAQLQLDRLDGESTQHQPATAPHEPASQQQRLLIQIDGERWWGDTESGQRLSLITLEPQVQQVLPDQHGRWLDLEGSANPFGPWWRVNRLCP